MKLQGRNLSNGDQGDDVRLLHHELRLLGFRLIPEATEVRPGIFGPHTLVAVREIQERAGLRVTGVVDEATARAINERVDALSREDGSTDGQEERLTGKERLVAGHVRREDGPPLSKGLVRVFHVDDRGPLRLGEGSIDEEGRYTLRYETPPEMTGVRLRVSVSGEGGRTLRSSDIIPDPKPVEIVNLTVPLTGEVSTRRWLEGRVVLQNGLPAENLKLVLMRHDFGSRTEVDETVTREGGLYTLSFDTGGKPVSLEVCAVDEKTPLSKILHNLGEQERTVLNLAAPR